MTRWRARALPRALWLSLALGWPGSVLAEPQPAAAPALKGCQLAMPGTHLRVAARCGRLAVPEDPARPEGRHIDLNLAVVPPRARQEAPDPVVFLTGGPGQAATEAFPVIAAAFAKLADRRAVVLVDQRGTGRSNALRCETSEEPASGPAELPEPAELARLTRACLERLPGDPRFYTTELAVGDLEQVRQAFGYRQLNLVGVSYGTRVALHYLRRFPQRVRTLVLDGVVPPELALGSEHARYAQRVLDALFERCRAQPACGARFPGLPANFAALRARLDANPVTVALADPRSGAPQAVSFGRDQLALAVRLLSYASETAALLPLLIHHARDSGDLSRLAAQSVMVEASLSDQLSRGMELAVICSEDVPFFDAREPAADRPDLSGYYLGERLERAARAQCRHWPAGAVSADFKAPVTSDTPALLLSGEVDPVTPPSYARRVGRTLGNSLHLVAAGQGHNVLARGCVPALVGRFVAAASVAGLDTGCVAELGPEPFFTSFAGPEP